LFHFLSELQAYRIKANQAIQNDDAASRHLKLLVEFIEKAYMSTSQQLKVLLKHHEITYELLWALFKPNIILYTTCSGTRKPRCFKYDFSEEKKLDNGMIYYSIRCRYLDFDGKAFGEVLTKLPILKFRGTQRINTLLYFLLQFHLDKGSTMTNLIKCGRRFISMMGPHYRHCRGDAFFMQDDRPFQVSVDCRIMVNTAFFHLDLASSSL
jgi:hypothetical protein